MARGDRINAGITERIRTSARSLTVHYPPVRVPATGTAPGAAPLRPLTGAPATLQLIDNTPDTPSQPPVTMQCLWLDTFHTMKTRTSTALQSSRREFGAVGWVEGAEAIARVLLEDALQDPLDPDGPTVFAECLYVESAGRRYRVLGQDPISSGFGTPISIYVWLIGAEGQ